MKFKKDTRIKIKKLSDAANVMFIGIFLFKFIPMDMFGQNIKFDASAHITFAMFCLYVIWFFIDQNKTWRPIFFIFSLMVLSIVSIQRILVGAHNDIGLLGGFIISTSAIVYSQRNYFKGKFKF